MSSSRASDSGVMSSAHRRGGPLCPPLRRGPTRRSAPTLDAMAIVAAATVSAQLPAPTERVDFQEAIRRAVERNPSAAIAAAGVLRAEGLLAEARSATRLQVNGTVTTTTLNRG